MYALTYLAYYSIQFQAKVFEHDYIYLPLCSLKNWYMHKDFFLCTLYNVHIIQALGSRFCQWSKESAVSVSVCPKSKSTMEVRAKIKNCKAIARIQNCTIREKFKYHCVMNELETEFVEVCAPEYYIHGTLLRLRRPLNIVKLKIAKSVLNWYKWLLYINCYTKFKSLYIYQVLINLIRSTSPLVFFLLFCSYRPCFIIYIYRALYRV